MEGEGFAEEPAKQAVIEPTPDIEGPVVLPVVERGKVLHVEVGRDLPLQGFQFLHDPVDPGKGGDDRDQSRGREGQHRPPAPAPPREGNRIKSREQQRVSHLLQETKNQEMAEDGGESQESAGKAALIKPADGQQHQRNVDQHGKAHVVLADLEDRQGRELINHRAAKRRPPVPADLVDKPIRAPAREGVQKNGDEAGHPVEFGAWEKRNEIIERVGIGEGQGVKVAAHQHRFIPAGKVSQFPALHLQPEGVQKTIEPVEIAQEQRLATQMAAENGRHQGQ